MAIKKTRSMLIFALTALTILMVFTQLTTATAAEVSTTASVYDVVNFPDPKLEVAIRQNLNKPTGEITAADMATINFFDARSRGITDLTGLEYAVNLRILVLYSNYITGLAPIAGLNNLQTALLSGNRITDISPLAQMTNLSYHLDLSYNQINDFTPIANLTKLTKLTIDGNNYATGGGITDLSFLNNLSLSGISLNRNNLTDISFVANMPYLQELYVELNQISDLSPVVDLKYLKWVKLGHNNIQDISPLANLASLYTLDLHSCQISQLPPTLNWPNLFELNLGYNQLIDISSLVNLPNIRTLDVHYNLISDISPLVANSGLGQGDFIPLYLNSLDLTPGTPAYSDLQALLNRSIQISYEPQRPVVHATDPVADTAEVPSDKILSIQFSKDIQASTNFSGISLKAGEETVGITSSINGNTLTITPSERLKSNTTYTVSIPAGAVKDLAGYEGYDLADDYSFDFTVVNWVNFPDANLEAAVRIFLGKPTGDITAGNMAGLTDLNGSFKGIQNLTGLEYAVNLQSLTLSYNNISDITPLASLTGLRYLRLENNSINDITPLANLTNLQTLNLNNNKIPDLSPLSNLNNLTKLELYGNSFTDLSPLAGLTSLTYLTFGKSGLTDLSPLANLINLEHVGFAYTSVEDISPLANLSKLKSLVAPSCRINALPPVLNLPNLTELTMGSNQIDDITSLANLPNLSIINLNQNRINDISSLVANTGLGMGDNIYIPYNYLNLSLGSQALADIETLKSRGVNMNHLPQIDIYGPRVYSTNPAANAVEVAVYSNITITFAENILAGPNLSGVTITDGKKILISFTSSISGNELTLDPTIDLDDNTTLTVYIPAGTAKDATGNLQPDAYSFSFATVQNSKK